MGHELDKLVGKTVTGGLFNQGVTGTDPKDQLMLVFSDGANFEISGEFQVLSDHGEGGYAAAKRYIAQFPQHRVTWHHPPEGETDSVSYATASRRVHERRPVSIEAKLSLILPELESQGHELPVTILDVSPSGMKIQASLAADIYAMLLRGVHYCRVTPKSSQGLVMDLSASVVCLERRAGVDNPILCNVGVEFYKQTPETQQFIADLIAEHA